jgi:hypothetical protein
LANRYVRICIHGGYAWIPLFRNVEWVLVHRRSRYNHMRVDLVLRSREGIVTGHSAGVVRLVFIRLNNAILVTKVIEGVRSVDCVAIAMLY